MRTSANICEICDMPIHHLSDFGTHLDGTINTEFCRFCFQNGLFLEHGITLEQKTEKNIRMAEKTGIPREVCTILPHSTLPTLKRWKGLKPVE